MPDSPQGFDVSDVIAFKYKGGRAVRGKVLSRSGKLIKIELYSDYIGRNEDWLVGEDKVFNLSEMREVTKESLT